MYVCSWKGFIFPLHPVAVDAAHTLKLSLSTQFLYSGCQYATNTLLAVIIIVLFGVVCLCIMMRAQFQTLICQTTIFSADIFIC